MFRISNVVSRARGLAVAMAALALLVSACGVERPYESLSADVANLRAQFNADAGKVRMLILPAPT